MSKQQKQNEPMPKEIQGVFWYVETDDSHVVIRAGNVVVAATCAAKALGVPTECIIAVNEIGVYES